MIISEARARTWGAFGRGRYGDKRGNKLALEELASAEDSNHHPLPSDNPDLRYGEKLLITLWAILVHDNVKMGIDCLSTPDYIQAVRVIKQKKQLRSRTKERISERLIEKRKVKYVLLDHESPPERHGTPRESLNKRRWFDGPWQI